MQRDIIWITCRGRSVILIDSLVSPIVFSIVFFGGLLLVRLFFREWFRTESSNFARLLVTTWHQGSAKSISEAFLRRGRQTLPFFIAIVSIQSEIFSGQFKWLSDDSQTFNTPGFILLLGTAVSSIFNLLFESPRLLLPIVDVNDFYYISGYSKREKEALTHAATATINLIDAQKCIFGDESLDYVIVNCLRAIFTVFSDKFPDSSTGEIFVNIVLQKDSGNLKTYRFHSPAIHRTTSDHLIPISANHTSKYEAAKAFADHCDKYNPDITRRPAFKSKSYKAVLCWPIEARGRVVGIVNIDATQADAFGNLDLRETAKVLCGPYVNAIALVIEDAMGNQKHPYNMKW